MQANNSTEDRTDSGLVTAVGVFPGYAEATRAIFALREAGFHHEQIGVAGPEGKATPKSEDFSGLPNDPTRTRWEEGAGIGAAVGGMAGLGLGAAVALGLMSPLGPIVAGGTLVALLASAGGGATVGTMVGALIGLGIPEGDAQWYVSEVEAGRVVVTVRGEEGERAREIMDRYGAIQRPGTGVESVTSVRTAVYGNAVPATPY
jgi:hypothetical protein